MCIKVLNSLKNSYCYWHQTIVVYMIELCFAIAVENIILHGAELDQKNS